MKYLCLIYSDEQVLHTSPDSPADPSVLPTPRQSRPVGACSPPSHWSR